MRWFRMNRRWGGRLAFFSLALQLVLSFGHIHAEDFVVPAASIASHAPTHTHHGVPSPASDTHDTCAICLFIQLASTTVQPTAPTLELPTQSDWVVPEEPIVSSLSAAVHFPFKARAPPSPGVKAV
jgi:hypothetical protein